MTAHRRRASSAHRPRGAVGLAAVALVALVFLAACDNPPTPSPTGASDLPGATDGLGNGVASAPPSPTLPSRPGTSAPSPSPTTRPTPTPSAASKDSGPTPCSGQVASGAAGSGSSESSTNWSGYAATADHSIFSCVEASWIQPTVRCAGTSRQSVSIWIGIGGFDQDGLEQIGTEVDCERGVGVGMMWHESLPTQHFEVPIHLEIKAGDRVRARVRVVSATVYELSIADLTRNTSFSIRDTNKRIHPTSAEWIVEAPTGGCPQRCHVLGLPNFGKFRFSGTWATASGIRQPLDGVGFSHVAIRMVSSGGAVRASVSSTAADGSSFVVAWRRS